jgi:hypothetical protein
MRLTNNPENEEACMKKLAGIIICGTTILLGSAALTRADEPSMKKGAEEVGDAIKDDAKDVGHKADEAVKEGVHATERGVGDAMEKTGEGMDHAGEKVKKEAE